jgi:hypothetical protein
MVTRTKRIDHLLEQHLPYFFKKFNQAKGIFFQYMYTDLTHRLRKTPSCLLMKVQILWNVTMTDIVMYETKNTLRVHIIQYGYALSFQEKQQHSKY